MSLKGINRLINQSYPVGQEEDPFDPSPAHQEVHQGDHRSGLPGTGGHGQEPLALGLHERFSQGLDNPDLVVPVHNLLLYILPLEALPGTTPFYEELELILGIEALNHPGGVCVIIPDPGLIAVGEENNRTAAVQRFDTVGVEFGLLLPYMGIDGCLLRLYDGHGKAVGSPEEIIDKALAPGVGHTRNGILFRDVGTDGPSRFRQELIDDELPGFLLGIVMAVGDLDIPVLCLRQFETKLSQFGVHLSQNRLPLFQGTGLLLDSGFPLGNCLLVGLPFLLPGHFPLLKGCGRRDNNFNFLLSLRRLKELRVEGNIQLLGIAQARIGPGHPVEDMEEFFTDSHRINGADLPLGVGRFVPRPLNGLNLGKERRRQKLLEGPFMNHGPQTAFVGTPQGTVVIIEPLNDMLQGQPGIETTSPGIGERQLFHPLSVREEFCIFRLEEGEVAHPYFSSSLTYIGVLYPVRTSLTQ